MATHSFEEAPWHSFEEDDDEVAWVASDDEYDDMNVSREPTSHVAGLEFSVVLIWLQTSGKISARDVCVLCYWAKHANLTGPATEFALRPDSPTGHFQRKLDACLGVKESIGAHAYSLTVPGTDRHAASRNKQAITTIVPHETLAEEIATTPEALGQLQDAVDNLEWGRSYAQHPVVREHSAAGPVWPLALYIDGVPFNQKDGLLGFWCYNLVTRVRHCCVVLRKSDMCTCGCLGWCSIYPVLTFLAWSLRSLAAGVAPARRHDGEAFSLDEPDRAARAGQPLPRAALIQVKGDWLEFVNTLGLRSWTHALDPCFCCEADREGLYSLGSTSPVSGPFPAKTHEDYLQACARAEVDVRIPDRETLERIAGYLVYDKAKGGGQGRCMSADFEGCVPPLVKGDRLVPQPGLMDVADFRLLPTPTTITFWRVSRTSLTKHRNPLFDARLGITVQSLMLDTLHILHLGVFKVYCCHALWTMVANDVWECGDNREDVRLQVNIERCRHELFAWYDHMRRAYPDWPIDKLNDLTPKMLGSKEHPHLSTKGAETATLLQFVVAKVTDHVGKLGEEGVALQACGDNLVRLLTLLRSNGPVLTTPANQAMVDAAKRAFVMAGAAGILRTPKFHLMLHLVANARYSGNPHWHSTFIDEGWNGRLKALACRAHRLNWHLRVLAHFRWAFTAKRKLAAR